MKTSATLDERLDKIDGQLERMAKAIVKGFAENDKNLEKTKEAVHGQIDIYARAIDSYAKTAETYMQEMLALGAKVDRLELQIEQIAKHLNLKLVS